MRASVLGNSPAYLLERPVTFVVVGPLGTARLQITGRPETWVEAINTLVAQTGVEALLTDAETTLEDGTVLDPEGDGYLLLFTKERGKSNKLNAGVASPVDGTGFTVTHNAGEGRDDPPTRPAALEEAMGRAGARAASKDPAPAA